MQVLFIDGIGGCRWMRGALLRRLADAGHPVAYFSCITALAGFDALQARLASQIRQVAAAGDYALIGYSFGGVLARAALQGLPADVRRPSRLVLLASPVRATRLAARLHNCLAYRLLTGDSGQLLASAPRMRAIGLPAVPTTCVLGRRRIPGWSALLGPRGVDDGMIRAAEAAPQRFGDVVWVAASHPVLPAHGAVLDILVDRMAAIPSSDG